MCTWTGNLISLRSRVQMLPGVQEWLGGHAEVLVLGTHFPFSCTFRVCTAWSNLLTSAKDSWSSSELPPETSRKKAKGFPCSSWRLRSSRCWWRNVAALSATRSWPAPDQCVVLLHVLLLLQAHILEAGAQGGHESRGRSRKTQR